MLAQIFHFIKYNNATVIILAIILILGGGALAAGPEAIGQKQTSVQGIDNTLLLAADLDNFNMDFKIEKIEQDEQYYYVIYSYLDLVVLTNAWQYQLNSKMQKISRKLKQDLGEYLVGFLVKHQEARTRQLKQEKHLAELSGAQTRTEVTEYSGLIGKTLNLASKAFPDYEPVKTRQLPAPENFNLPTSSTSLSEGGQTQADNLTQDYNNFLATHLEIFETLTAPAQADAASSALDTATSADATVPEIDTSETDTAVSETDTAVSETDAAVLETPVGSEISAITEPESVDIIELPTLTPTENIVPAEPAPAPAPEAPAEPEPTQ